jgi:predicted aspartyl protease
MAQQLLQQGIPLPSPVSGIALIDTGASHTCIDAESAQAMNLPVIDVVKMASASHDATDQNVYPIQIELAGLPITIQAPRAIGAALKPQGLLLLIGRDLLQHCALTYNGMAGTITLAI